VRLAERLRVPAGARGRYGEREQTRTEHLGAAARYLGWRPAKALELKELEEFLLARAMEHDAPSLLHRLACEYLISAKVIRPGVVVLLERVAAARAAAQAGTIYIASTLSNYSLEEIAAASPATPLWLQLYVFRDRAITEELVRRAERAGCRALCLTASVPVQGNRERDAHNRFGLPAELEIGNFRGLRQGRLPETQGSALLAFIAAEFDPTVTWEVLTWLRSITSLPVWVKGVMTAADARLAHEHGAAGVIVSNHGGRQLDGAQATLRVLPDVTAAVADRLPVLLDGGVRRGTDVIKALLLGARAVLIGRPYLWGLAAGGEAGVAHVLEILRDEVRRTLALLGAPSLQQLDGALLAE
jgi:isopentenyl diphosphate isomerase/L-lactate dehydrogenase-like FMN-dependent dehydrogenase